jgi:uncharacterized protein (TIGR03000 family)
MKSATVGLASAALVALLWLGTPARVAALPSPYPLPRPGPIHPPGWDWWRTYPWSPYNYGRNPYNPIIMPYVYPYPDPYPVYVTPPAAPAVMTQPAGPALPTVTGPLASPAPGTAIIRVKVPTVWAKVLFNGTDSVTSGKLRWFTTPPLADGKNASYKVTATWTSQGQQMQSERTVTVKAGQNSEVDFTRAGTQ